MALLSTELKTLLPLEENGITTLANILTAPTQIDSFIHSGDSSTGYTQSRTDNTHGFVTFQFLVRDGVQEPSQIFTKKGESTTTEDHNMVQ